MPFDYEAHRQNMVKRFLALHEVDPAFARAQLAAYAGAADCPCPGIKADVQAAWKAHQAAKGLPKPDK